MHSPLEIARNYIEVGIHKVNLSIFKTILLGFFAGMFIGFAGIASTTASSTIGIASVAKLVGAAVFPAGMAMVLVAGSELFTGNNLIILAVLEKKVTVWKMLKNWLFVYIGNFIGAAFVAVLVVVGRTPDLFGEQLAQAIVNAAAARTNLSSLWMPAIRTAFPSFWTGCRRISRRMILHWHALTARRFMSTKTPVWGSISSGGRIFSITAGKRLRISCLQMRSTGWIFSI